MAAYRLSQLNNGTGLGPKPENKGVLFEIPDGHDYALATLRLVETETSI